MRKGDSGGRKITRHKGPIPHHRLAGRGDGARRIQIPVYPNAPFGSYLLEVGMYQAETGARLPAFDEEGNRLEGDRVILATIRIEE